MQKTITLLLVIFSLNASAQSSITWGMGTNVATSASGNEHPRIALDGAGNPLVLWGHSNRAMFSYWNGTMFTAPVMINPMSRSIAEANWMGPDIASHGDTVYVVMKQIPEAADTSHLMIRKSVDGGMTFGPTIIVDNIADSISRFPTVTVDNNGNPVVGFMKFDASFMDSRWVVARSNNLGTSFQIDRKASGWSGGLICDCCPGQIIHNGNDVHMVYRDNLNNTRVIWDGVSTDNGASFNSGFLADQTSWSVNMCPGSGPDATIIGDTLYTTFFNRVTGTARVYLSRSSVSNATCSNTSLLTGMIMNLNAQNFPRIASYGNALAVIWTQNVNGNDELMMRFTPNILNGLPATLDTVDLGHITNTDVILSNGKIFVVWEDDNSGTVKYREGTFTPDNTAVNFIEEKQISVYPNPATNELQIENFVLKDGDEIEIVNVIGQTILSKTISSSNENTIDVSKITNGIYFLKIISGNETFVTKFVKD